jgi:hypothetical protein
LYSHLSPYGINPSTLFSISDGLGIQDEGLEGASLGSTSDSKGLSSAAGFGGSAPLGESLGFWSDEDWDPVSSPVGFDAPA